MKKAFTMIELIFVIIIIGILAAVAIPKLASTVTESKKALVLSYISTLNRTVGATMYTSTLHTADVGKVTNVRHCGTLSTVGNAYLDPIDEVSIDVNCNLTSNIDDDFKEGSHFTYGNASDAPYWHYSFY